MVRSERYNARQPSVPSAHHRAVRCLANDGGARPSYHGRHVPRAGCIASVRTERGSGRSAWKRSALRAPFGRQPQAHDAKLLQLRREEQDRQRHRDVGNRAARILHRRRRVLRDSHILAGSEVLSATWVCSRLWAVITVWARRLGPAGLGTEPSRYLELLGGEDFVEDLLVLLGDINSFVRRKPDSHRRRSLVTFLELPILLGAAEHLDPIWRFARRRCRSRSPPAISARPDWERHTPLRPADRIRA